MTTNEFNKYFMKRKPIGAVVLLIFGVLFFTLGILLPSGYLWSVIGVVLAAPGVFLLIRYLEKYSDKAVDAHCSALATEYYNVKKAVVDSKEQAVFETTTSDGYCFEKVFNPRWTIRSRDGKLRSSIYEMTCIFFTEEKAYYFSKKASLISDDVTEIQKEFRLQDVQLVSLEQINQSVVVVISIPGSENLYVNCETKEQAVSLCDKIKEKVYEKDLIV